MDSRNKKNKFRSAFKSSPDRGGEDLKNNSDLYEKILRERESELEEELDRQAEMQRAAESAKIKKRTSVFFRFLIVLVIMAVLTCIIVYVVYKFIFVVSEIDVSGNDGISSEEIIKSSGIVKGDNLYSFDIQKRSELIRFFIPEIKSAEIKRYVPSRINIEVETEKTVFCTEIYGERYLLSESLRIMKRCEHHEEECPARCELRLPVVNKALAGSEIGFEKDRHRDNVYNTAEAVLKSDLKDRIVSIDMRDGFSLTMVCDGRYLFSFGDYSDTDIKLKLAYQILQDQMFSSDKKAILDLSDINATIVTFDENWSY